MRTYTYSELFSDDNDSNKSNKNDNKLMTDYLNGLNPVQRAAVEHTSGPVMVLAGPGSGKTRVLTFRIAHLIQQGVAPYHILALTFTNKAAKEMKERIGKIVGEEVAKQLWMGTFHAIFARILRIEAKHLGYPTNFTIYDTEDTKKLIQIIIKEQNLNTDLYKANAIYNRISNAKNAFITPAEYLVHPQLKAADAQAKRPKIGELYNRYVARCKKAGAMDFDDLLLNMHLLLSRHPEVALKYQQKFRYLMIDEFQDTNQVQYQIVKHLGKIHGNICVVGDDAQSIYAFRGATIENILSFERDYKETQIFKLEQNYRSTQKIVTVANEIIAANSKQLAKKIWTENTKGKDIKLYQAASDSDEAKIIADAIFSERHRSQLRNDEFAILYRTNAQSRALEEALRRKGLPYRIYGGLSFYQRKEIKDMMAYFRLTTNPSDEQALRRVINYPTRGIGQTTLQKIAAWAEEYKTTMWNIIVKIKQFPLAGRSKDAILRFAKLIMAFQTIEKKKDAFELAKYIGKNSGLLAHLHNDKTTEGLNRYENLQELFNSIQEFVQNRRELVVDNNTNSEEDNTQDDTLGAYLQEVSLLTDMDNDSDDSGKIKLMTIHAAKGLEFPAVYIAGLEEGLFPSQLSLKRPSDIEEERRLFYVAVTRAEKQLNLSYARCRYKFGKLQYSDPSRFINNISPLHIDVVGGKLGNKSTFAKSSAFDSFKEGESSSSIKSNIRNAKRKQPPIKHQYSNIEFKASPKSDLKEGQRVLHNRFGPGTILLIDGVGDKKMATVKFDSQGEKRLVLRFAKLMILPTQ